MNAVFSLWKKPIDRGLLLYGYNSVFDLACSYVLAIEEARKYYKNVNLITDDSGYNLLVNSLGIEFNTATFELNEISNLSPLHWSIPKILACKIQREEFIYLEGNIYLWNDLPEELKKLDIVFQNAEPEKVFDELYVAHIKQNYSKAPVKPELVTSNEVSLAYNTSLTLANNLDYIGSWTGAAIDYVMRNENAGFWTEQLNAGLHHNMIFDYWFPACIAEKYGLPKAEMLGFYLKDYDAGENKYTHTHGFSRREPNVTEGVWKHIQENYPKYIDALQKLKPKSSADNLDPLI
jgi:hypothetical protein